MFTMRCLIRFQNSIQNIHYQCVSKFSHSRNIINASSFNHLLGLNQKCNHIKSKRFYVPGIKEQKGTVSTTNLAKRIIRKKRTGEKPGVSFRFTLDNTVGKIKKMKMEELIVDCFFSLISHKPATYMHARRDLHVPSYKQQGLFVVSPSTCRKLVPKFATHIKVTMAKWVSVGVHS